MNPHGYNYPEDLFPAAADATAHAWTKTHYARKVDCASAHADAARLHEKAEHLHRRAAQFSIPGPYSLKPYHLHTANVHRGLRDNHSSAAWIRE